MTPTARNIIQRLSLRFPQQESLEILERLTQIIPLSKTNDLEYLLKTVQEAFPTVTDLSRVRAGRADACGLDICSTSFGNRRCLFAPHVAVPVAALFAGNWRGENPAHGRVYRLFELSMARKQL